VGPESAEALRARFEGDPDAAGRGAGAARVGDGTWAWRAGLDEWVLLGAVAGVSGDSVGRAAGWKPRREQAGAALDEARFGLGAECCKCGGVATLHSIDALGLDATTAATTAATAAAPGAAPGAVAKVEGQAAARPLRAVPPSGRKPARNSNEMAREVLPDFLWVGNAASSRRGYLKRSPISHVLNVTEVSAPVGLCLCLCLCLCLSLSPGSWAACGQHSSTHCLWRERP
jgi:hypothetical protein